MLTRKPKAALLALAVVLVSLSASLVALSPSAAEVPVAVPVVPPVAAPVACVGSTQAQFAKRAQKVYGRPTVSRKAEAALDRMIGSACSARAGSNMLAVKDKLQRKRKGKLYCKSPACNHRLLLSYATKKLGAAQARCLESIARNESGFNHLVTNREGSGATGIPQALPGDKMRSAGADWATNPLTQIKWMIGYVNSRYGSACGAWAHWQSARSY